MGIEDQSFEQAATGIALSSVFCLLSKSLLLTVQATHSSGYGGGLVQLLVLSQLLTIGVEVAVTASRFVPHGAEATILRPMASLSGLLWAQATVMALSAGRVACQDGSQMEEVHATAATVAGALLLTRGGATIAKWDSPTRPKPPGQRTLWLGTDWHHVVRAASHQGAMASALAAAVAWRIAFDAGTRLVLVSSRLVGGSTEEQLERGVPLLVAKAVIVLLVCAATDAAVGEADARKHKMCTFVVAKELYGLLQLACPASFFLLLLGFSSAILKSAWLANAEPFLQHAPVARAGVTLMLGSIDFLLAFSIGAVCIPALADNIRWLFLVDVALVLVVVYLVYSVKEHLQRRFRILIRVEKAASKFLKIAANVKHH